MKIYTQRSSTSCHVCKIPARTRIYITLILLSVRLPLLLPLHLLSRCAFVVLQAKLPKEVHIIDFFKINECFYCLSKFTPFFFFKIQVLLLFRGLSAKLFSAYALGFLVNSLSQVPETRAMIWCSSVPKWVQIYAEI